MPNYRVRIEADLDAEEPYDDGSSPLLRIGTLHYGNATAEQVKRTSYEVPANIIEAAERWGKGIAFERYLRAFHGTRSIVWYEGGHSYVTFDTADWRARMGLTDEYLAVYSDGAPLANLDEWIAYCEGNVYGFIVEEETLWTSANGAEKTTWEEVDSCWGFYGFQYAEEAGNEALNAFTVAS